MKLTVEENREAIKRYSHIRPASRVGATRCASRCAGTSRTCSLQKGHRGPHVAHGMFSKVLAVWDGGSTVAGGAAVESRSAAGAIARKDLRDGGVIAALKALARRVVRRPQYSMEEGFLLVMFLGMVAFVVSWAVQIIGGG